jgi:DNA-binding Lrp family transcriptional regulator
MVVSDTERRLIAALQPGLPLTDRPYAAVAEAAGMSEDEVIEGIAALIERGVIKRFGIVVRHRELGYRANAMVVWDVPNDQVADIGRRMAESPAVTLCYRRPRRRPDWQYNLFCMIHGRDRGAVARQVEALARELDIAKVPREVLFSGRRFKQRGADYQPTAMG